MVGRRVTALLALVLFLAGVVVAVVEIVRDFPRGPVVIVLLVVGAVAAWHAVQRRGYVRYILLASFALLLVAAIVVVLTGERLGVGLVAVALLLASVGLAGRVFTVRVALPAAEPPKRAIVVWNPKSGGGKAVSNNLADEARARGIEPIELKPGDDLEQLVRDAVAAGADGLAAAGGDGTQALVASIAAEHDLPFACIPAGTRNHFALDLGVDRDDVVGALDAFVTGGEHRVDLAEINGRVFVNNVSLGLYAEAVQREGYRDAKLRTMLDTMPDVLGSKPTDATSDLGWRGPDGAAARGGGRDPDLEQRLSASERRRIRFTAAPRRRRARDRRVGAVRRWRRGAGSSGRHPRSRSPPPSRFRWESTGRHSSSIRRSGS